jgi:hypothetical protein
VLPKETEISRKLGEDESGLNAAVRMLMKEED